MTYHEANHSTSDAKCDAFSVRLQHTCRLLLLPSPLPFTRFESLPAAAAVLLISFNECLREGEPKRGVEWGGMGMDRKDGNLKMGELKPMPGLLRTHNLPLFT